MRKWSNLIVLAFVALCAFIVWMRMAPQRAPQSRSSRADGGTPASAPAGDGNSVEILFSSSDGKKEWVDAVTEAFHRSRVEVNGRPVHVTVNHMRGGESRQKILAGQEKPTIWSPAGPSWVELINRDWQLREHKPFLE